MQVKSSQVSSQFKFPRHHELNHLGAFRKVSVQTLSFIVGPWHHLERLQSEVGVVAWRASDALQGSLQQLIHYKGELSAKHFTPYLLLCCNPTS